MGKNIVTKDSGSDSYRLASSPVSVTVVIPCYRCADSIRRAVDSIAQQTVLPEKVILVDDLSGDDTLAALNALTSRYPADWIEVIAKQTNDGPGVTRNVGWDAASSRFVAFLDADDSWHPRKIELQYAVMTSRPQLALSGHRGVNLDGDHGPLAHHAVTDPSRILVKAIGRQRLLWFNEFITRSVMVKTDLNFRFDPKMRYCEDYLLWMRIVFGGHDAAVIEERLAYAYKANSGDGGLSAQLWKMEAGEILAYNKINQDFKLGVLRMAPIMVFSVAKYLRRLLFSFLRKAARRLR